MTRISLTLLAFLCGVSTALAGSNHDVRHDKILHSRLSSNHTERNSGSAGRDWKLEKRSFDNARFSNYEAGLGACGKTNSDSDFIVALNSAQYSGGAHCFAIITISYNGKSTSAQIVDECPGCPFGGLDLTPSLFAFLAPIDDGIIYGSWDFADGSSSSSSSSSTFTPTSTSTKQSTSTFIPPTTTSSSSSSTFSPTSTSSFSSSTSSSSTLSSSTSSSSTASSSSTSSATPSVTAGASADSFISMLDFAVMQLGGLIAGGARANETSSSD